MTRTIAPDLSVCNALHAASAVAGSTLNLKFEVNLFQGPERFVVELEPQRYAVPHRAVFVLTTGGEAPEPFKDRTVKDMLRAHVTVLIRSDVDQFEVGQNLAREVWFALQHEGLPGYMECQCLESEPRYTGQDDTGHHDWEIQLRLTREEAI